MVFWESRYSVATGVFGLLEDDQHVLAAAARMERLARDTARR